MELAIIVAVVAAALGFAYTNGFHDAANAIATSVATRALTPRVALVMAAALNFAGAFLGQKVARTVSETITPPDGSRGLVVVLAALIGAIAWNLVTWWFGLPTSSSHALIGGLAGAALAAGAAVSWSTVVDKVLIPMLVSPVVAFGLAFALMVVLLRACADAAPARAQRGFRLAQTMSAAAMALGHGLQDAQKTMGVIFLALLTGGYVAEGDGLPLWVIVSAAGAISLGTLAGGWRIIRTLGRRIIALDPAGGFAAESVAAGVLYTTAYLFEAPISTSQTITSAVVGVGATKRLSAIRWGVTRSILVGWVLTFPLAAGTAAAAYAVLSIGLG
jgi:PiT family inorganic phosphate transporter